MQHLAVTTFSFPSSTAAFAPIAVGFFHLGTGGWLTYLTFTTALNFAPGSTSH